VECLPQPETIRLLVVDDEPEVGAMIRDFLEGRTAPQFTIECAANGEIAFKKIRQKLPDVVLMDIKMPVRDGRELYRDLVISGLHVPVIVFFDAVSTEELAEIYSLGRPMVVEKGSRQSSPQELINLIKKMAYFR
jgi:CheY-like chemotaxis protein